MPKFLCDYCVGNTENCLEIVEAEDREAAEHQLDLRIRATLDMFSCREITDQEAKELKSSGKLRPYDLKPLTR